MKRTRFSIGTTASFVGSLLAASLLFPTPASGQLTLPYTGSASTTGNIFSIIGSNSVSIQGYNSEGVGLWGQDTANGIGVEGLSYSGIAGFFQSSTSHGVYGKSLGNGNGVFGDSFSGYGVYGSTMYGSSAGYFFNTYYDPANVGVTGLSTSGYGVSGTGGNIGVYGTTSSGGKAGYFYNQNSNSNSSVGVYGQSTIGYGVYGIGGNVGVYASNTQSGNAAYLATTGLAGNFYGGVFVHGPVTATAYYYTSDARYKTHVAAISHPLETILGLRGVSFDWNRDAYPNMHFEKGHQVGFLAQEVEKVAPNLVTQDEKGYRAVAYTECVPILVEAVKQQQRQIATQRGQITQLQKENAMLKTQASERKRQQQQLAELDARLRRMEAKGALAGR